MTFNGDYFAYSATHKYIRILRRSGDVHVESTPKYFYKTAFNSYKKEKIHMIASCEAYRIGLHVCLNSMYIVGYMMSASSTEATESGVT